MLDPFAVLPKRIYTGAVITFQGLEIHIRRGLERLARLPLIRRDRFQPYRIGLAEFFIECRTHGIAADELLGLDDEVLLDFQSQDEDTTRTVFEYIGYQP